MSRLDYCNSLYCASPKREIVKLQRVQNCAPRLVSGIGRSDHVTPIMKDLHCLPLRAPIDFKILHLTFRILNDLASYYLSSLLLKYQRARLLRLSNGLLLQVPSVNTVTHRHRSFSYYATKSGTVYLIISNTLNLFPLFKNNYCT